MAAFRLGERSPQAAASAWIAPSASVIGDVVLGEDASVWYGAVLRGDNDRIVLGRGANVQDGSVLHTDEGIGLEIGAGVTVGHMVMLHGCTIGEDSLVGLQSVVLNRARIGRRCLVGAGSLITEGKAFPDGVLILGRPAKVVRPLEAEEIERLRWSARHYVELARRHRATLAALG
jgi:carbonic anhydrase/acetyltransferase-like protein (isoleucine patch superfamily)